MQPESIWRDFFSNLICLNLNTVQWKWTPFFGILATISYQNERKLTLAKTRFNFDNETIHSPMS